jgi:hypothetical protein
MALSGLSAGLQGLTLPLNGQRLGVSAGGFLDGALTWGGLPNVCYWSDPSNYVIWSV